ncbi:MAG: hypothetical protein R3B74_14550 [Nitrospirales bacterium]|nr:hypothetical protein [Nitrospirales bacterium]
MFRSTGLPLHIDIFECSFILGMKLGCPVDPVKGKALRSELRPFIEREAVNI